VASTRHRGHCTAGDGRSFGERSPNGSPKPNRSVHGGDQPQRNPLSLAKASVLARKQNVAVFDQVDATDVDAVPANHGPPVDNISFSIQGISRDAHADIHNGLQCMSCIRGHSRMNTVKIAKRR
jgi:hypothetical protein